MQKYKFLSKISALLKIIDKNRSSSWKLQEFKELRLHFKYIIIALKFYRRLQSTSAVNSNIYHQI